MQITIGKENLHKFINELVKDTSLATNITEDVCTEIRSNNFSLIPNDTEPFNIAMEIFASCKNEQLMKLLSNIIGDFVFHDLRHNVATRLDNNNIDIETIKELLAHSDISTTQIYLHTNEDNISNAIDILDRFI